MPPVYDINDFVERFNALHPRVRGRPRWTADSMRRLLKAFGVEFVQERKGKGSRGSKIYVTHEALMAVEGARELMNSLLDVESLRRAGGGDDEHA